MNETNRVRVGAESPAARSNGKRPSGAALAYGLVMTLGLPACALADGAPEAGVTAQAVLDGERVRDCEWPSVVSLGGCSGVLVHPRLVVYAAHCGDWLSEIRFGPNAEAPAFVVATDRCRAMPGAALGNGTDLAYCVLEEAVVDIEPARVLAGCEVERLTEGAAVRMVGFGADGAEGQYGTERVGSSAIAAVGVELLLDSDGVDTCLGDSGGPLFLDVEEPDGTVSPRVVGITSAGTEEACGSGLSHYVNLTRQIAWLEESSGLDVTPCFDGDVWAPTPECRSLPGMELDEDDDDGRSCRLAAEPRPLATCGDAFAAEPDEEAPSLEITAPNETDIEHVLAAEEEYLELEIAVAAKDEGWGVKEVRFSLVDARDEPQLERIDQVPPYGIPVLRIPEGSFSLTIEAIDHAGNRTTEVIALDVTRPGTDGATPEAGCHLVPVRVDGWSWWLLAMVGWPLLRLGRRRGRGRALAPSSPRDSRRSCETCLSMPPCAAPSRPATTRG